MSEPGREDKAPIIVEEEVDAPTFLRDMAWVVHEVVLPPKRQPCKVTKERRREEPHQKAAAS